MAPKKPPATQNRTGEKKTGTKTPYKRHGRGPVALSAMLPKIAGKALRRRGFAEAAIITNWEAIVGDVLARESIPEKLRFPRGENTGATLHVRVSGAFSTELQHLAPLVVEKINAYFGYAAVARLTMAQGPITRARDAPKRKTVPPLSGPPSPALRQSFANIEDDNLRASLTELGALLGKEND
mgnify:FL=1